MLTPVGPSELTVPRPFSVYDQPDSMHLSFLIQVMGSGTQVLDELTVGESLRWTGPLGNGFEVAPPDREVVFLAGGVGSAPFLLYSRARETAQARTHLIFGARTEERLYDRHAFDGGALKIQLATDDGSAGFHGNAVQALEAELKACRISREALFCACGPPGLLHGFADFAREGGLEFQLSLETYMGCGIGVCNGCPTRTTPTGRFAGWPWAKTCTDGPVFSGADVDF
jgi:dihydroorotate dehydrogenase electron transfer subunit